MGVLLLASGLFLELKSYFEPQMRKKRFSFKKEEIDYSVDEKYLLEYLYSLSFNNRNDVEESNFCYCFYCNKKLDNKEIIEYESDIHALCPYCSKRSILAEESDIEINDYTVDLMNRYWF